ncbi:MAG: hypothetical protein WA085_20725, partial [Sphingobium sp.]
MAAAKSSEQAGARIGNNVGLRTGAASVKRSKAIGGAPLALILLTAASVTTAVAVAAADDHDGPASPAS